MPVTSPKGGPASGKFGAGSHRWKLENIVFRRTGFESECVGGSKVRVMLECLIHIAAEVGLYRLGV